MRACACVHVCVCVHVCAVCACVRCVCACGVRFPLIPHRKCLVCSHCPGLPPACAGGAVDCEFFNWDNGTGGDGRAEAGSLCTGWSPSLPSVSLAMPRGPGPAGERMERRIPFPTIGHGFHCHLNGRCQAASVRGNALPLSASSPQPASAHELHLGVAGAWRSVPVRLRCHSNKVG